MIELIVVIAILAILALIAIPRIAGFTEAARQANDEEAAAIVANAMAMYVASHQADPGWVFDIAAAPAGVNIAALTASDLILADDLTLVSDYYGPGAIADADLSISDGTVDLDGDGTAEGAGQVAVTLDGDVDYIIVK